MCACVCTRICTRRTWSRASACAHARERVCLCVCVRGRASACAYAHGRTPCASARVRGCSSVRVRVRVREHARAGRPRRRRKDEASLSERLGLPPGLSSQHRIRAPGIIPGFKLAVQQDVRVPGPMIILRARTQACQLLSGVRGGYGREKVGIGDVMSFNRFVIF